jgi:hypothetical protein
MIRIKVIETSAPARLGPAGKSDIAAQGEAMSTKRNYMWGWIILAGVLAGAAAQADPIQLQAYTGAVGGSNECPGGGPPVVTHFFSTLGTFGLGAGGNGISDCGLTGSVLNVVHAGVGAPPAISATNLPAAGYQGSGFGTYSGSGNANANFGSLSVSADGTLTGLEPANGYAESIGLAIADDTLNIPAGTGFMEFQYTLNGGLSQSASDLASGIISAQVQVGSVTQQIFYGLIAGNVAGAFGPNGTGAPGCVVGAGNFECTNALISTTMLPVTPGMGVTFDTGLMVSTDLANGASSVDPSPGMTLSGIELFDANGNPISDFSLTSGSGALYGANGLLGEPTSATPEPAMWWVLASGFLLVIVVARIRQRRSSDAKALAETVSYG